MIDTVRLTLNNFSKSTKTIILNLTMLVLLALALLFIYFSTLNEHTQNTLPSNYDSYLQKFHHQYKDIQSDYRTYAFYQTYDQLIFSEKQLDERYKEGLNKIYNYSQAQFQQFYTIVTAIARKKGYQEIAEFEDDHYYDWEQFLPPVKDMKGYDGSHIFAAVSEMEFEVNRKRTLVMREVNKDYNPAFNWILLSQQEVIDCCPRCIEKKSPQYVYKHFLEYGISTADTYPYTSAVYSPPSDECKTMNKDKNYKIRGWYRQSGCEFIRQRLRDGPVVVWVDARAWRDYQGGILQSCGSVRNHYALLVGRGIGYWKIRNSWGQLWGEHGHIRIKSGNTCGICGTSSFIDYQ